MSSETISNGLFRHLKPSEEEDFLDSMESLQEVMVIVRMSVCVCGLWLSRSKLDDFFWKKDLESECWGTRILEVVGWKLIEHYVPGIYIYRYISILISRWLFQRCLTKHVFIKVSPKFLNGT